MPSYNLFRSKIGGGICLAVPEDLAVPYFVTGSRWSFGGRIDDEAAVPEGFDGVAASSAVRSNGYYLFRSGG